MLLALTGGPATGKSTFAALLAGRHTFETFDADACVHGLLAADHRIIAAVASEFGPEVLDPAGAVHRPALRALVFPDPAARRRLEAILHPAVRARWLEQSARCRDAGRDFLADIPLLFETGADRFFDATVTVATAAATQRGRLLARGLDHATIEALLASQLPMEEKNGRASSVVWNDGALGALARQADLLLERLSILPQP
ncbi:MAG: dephospho-CoA kinase [Chthoniobacterales bacterium]